LLPLALLLIAPACERRWVRVATVTVLVYCLAGNWWTSPNHLAYFNLLAGGPRNGHRILLDSNLDWGQDLCRLPSALAEMNHDGPVQLPYFGHVDPRLYGIEYDWSHLTRPLASSWPACNSFKAVRTLCCRRKAQQRQSVPIT
jgi:hypothetical protein